jgi:hypothetical protein
MPSIKDRLKKLESAIKEESGRKILIRIDKGKNYGEYYREYKVEVVSDEDSTRSTSSLKALPVAMGEILFSGTFEVKEKRRTGKKRVLLNKELTGRHAYIFNYNLGEELDKIIMAMDEEGTSKAALMLDKVADQLEAKGLRKEATELDILANTIESTQKAKTAGLPDLDKHSWTEYSVTLEDIRHDDTIALLIEHDSEPDVYIEAEYNMDLDGDDARIEVTDIGKVHEEKEGKKKINKDPGLKKKYLEVLNKELGNTSPHARNSLYNQLVENEKGKS